MPHSTSSKLRYIAAGAVFLTAFVVYFLTLAPTVTLVDSGELILASARLGVAHPPGFPLYVLLAHLASLVPIGGVAVRVHVASAFFAALAASMMTLLIGELMLTAAQRIYKKKKEKTEPAEPKAAYVLGPAVTGGLLFAFSRTLWSYATIAEVYTLNSLLIVTVVWLMFAWRREFDREAPSYRKLYIAALVFGLGMCVHHVTVAFYLPSLAVLVYSTAGKQFFFSKRLLFAALIGFAGLSIYVYLPLAASRSPIMNWGEPTTIDAVWAHISGRQYQSFFSFEPGRLLDLVRFVSREWSMVWLPAALLLAMIGLVDRFRRDRMIFVFLILVICIDIVYCTIYTIAEDRDAYYLPAFIAVTIAAACGARWLLERIKETETSLLTATHVAAALLIVPIIAFASNLPYNDRDHFYVAHDYVDNIEASVEPSGMLLTSDWQVYSPAFYTREIEGQRKDVVRIDVNLLRRSWYFGYLDKAFPEVMARSRDKIMAYREELRAWDRDPAAYDRSATLNQRINQRFQEMIVSLVTEQLKAAPLYITEELADSNAMRALGLGKLQETYDIVPQGLVFRLVEKGSADTILPPEIKTRGLNDDKMKFDDDDVVKKSVIPVYTNMLTNTGLYLGAKGMPDRAVTYFRQALSIDPTFEAAKKGLATSQAAMRK